LCAQKNQTDESTDEHCERRDAENLAICKQIPFENDQLGTLGDHRCHVAVYNGVLRNRKHTRIRRVREQCAEECNAERSTNISREIQEPS